MRIKFKRQISLMIALAMSLTAMPVNTFAVLSDLDQVEISPYVNESTINPTVSDALADAGLSNATISKAVIDSDGNTTINGDYILIVNNSDRKSVV